MGTQYFANYSFRDLKGNAARMEFERASGAGWSAVNALWTALKGLSDCGSPRVSLGYNQWETYVLGGNKDRRGVINATDQYGKSHTWELPGYSGPVEVDKSGEYIPEATVASIISAIEGLGLYTLTPSRCPIIQKV